MSTPSSQSNSIRKGTLLLLCLLAYFAYLIRFGYGYGSSDQDEFLPFLFSILQPELFQNDWFVQSQSSAFSVRTYFVYLLRGLSFLFPPWLSVALVYLTSWLGISAALLSIGFSLTRDRLAAAGASVLILVATPFWTLGGNDLVHSMLVPSMTAWAVGLWGLYYYIENRVLLTAVLLGIATWFQALVGLQLAAILGLALFFNFCKSHQSLFASSTSLLEYGPVYALSASPALIPLFYQQFTQADTSLDAGIPSLFYIMGAFRNPHHYLFFSFDEARAIRFAGVVLLGCLSLIALRRSVVRTEVRCILGLASICSAFWVVGFVCTEIFEVLPVAKLQLFKSSVLVKALMVIAVCAWFSHLLPTRIHRFFDRLAYSQTWVLVFLAIVAAAGVYLYQPQRPYEKIYPLSRNSESIAEVETWIEANTPVDAVFLIPPSISTFRSHARRAIVINHKSFPYRDADIGVWFERISAVAPIPLPQRTGPLLTVRLDSAYHSLRPAELDQLTRQYQADYILRQTPIPSGANGFSSIYETDSWYLYKSPIESERQP